MAVQLFKLVMSASKPTTTTAPTSLRYYFTQTTDYTGVTPLVITSTDMYDDTGTKLTGALTIAKENNGYYQLFINGVTQQKNLYAVDSGGASVTITLPTADSKILANSVIVLIVTNFTPTTTAPTITG
jgi:hypothetical protein